MCITPAALFYSRTAAHSEISSCSYVKSSFVCVCVSVGSVGVGEMK